MRLTLRHVVHGAALPDVDATLCQTLIATRTDAKPTLMRTHMAALRARNCHVAYRCAGTLIAACQLGRRERRSRYPFGAYLDWDEPFVRAAHGPVSARTVDLARSGHGSLRGRDRCTWIVALGIKVNVHA